jgi:hypothetical protein
VLYLVEVYIGIDGSMDPRNQGLSDRRVEVLSSSN